MKSENLSQIPTVQNCNLNRQDIPAVNKQHIYNIMDLGRKIPYSIRYFKLSNLFCIEDYTEILISKNVKYLLSLH